MNRKYIQADDYELWVLIKKGPLIPKKAIEDGKITPEEPEEFNAEDFRMMEKNAKAKKLCILALVLMSILASLSASQPKKFRMPSKLLMKVQVK